MPVSDRAKAGLAAFIRSVVGLNILGPRMDYTGKFPAKVVSQNGDGTLELQPDDNRLPPYSKVPIRYGVPGVTATVAAGARCLLTFAAADPQQPIVVDWEASSSALITLNVVGTTLNLGATYGLQGCGLGDQLATALANIVTFLTTHTHAGVTTGGGTSGVSATAPPSIGTVSSSSVKVKP